MSVIQFFATAFLSLGSPAASEVPVSLFGITMLEPLLIPACPIVGGVAKFAKDYEKRGRPSWATVPYSGPLTGPCFKRNLPNAIFSTPPTDEWVRISYPTHQQPELATYDSVVVSVIDGRVQGISFHTVGLSAQSLVLAALTKKYGKPSTDRMVSKQNSYGAKYDSVVAVWTLTDLITAKFEGVAESLNDGFVKIETPLEHEKNEALERALISGTPM
jgi:hypothetical protein